MKKKSATVQKDKKAKLGLADLSIQKRLRKVGFFWFRHYGLFFILTFILASAFSVYLLYKNIYLSDWSEEEKREYINSKQSLIELKQEKFDGVVENIQERHENSQKEFVPIENVFEALE